MTKNKLLMVSVLSALTASSAALAQPGGAGHFAKLDTNSDGVVTTAELEAGAVSRFTSADANHDGKVTADEMKAAFAQHKQERFTERDANHDGVLQRSEVPKMPDAAFTKLDVDKSGTLSSTELQNGHLGHHGKGDLKKLPGDADGDGVVTKSEAVAGADKLAKQLDSNGDGKLSQDELAKGPWHHGGHGGHHGDHDDSADED
ncbi:MAG: EF-hand domain pair family protein [Myxococcaceae bacterium]|nr:EF-hand domain pair family protein [Myxococcaceae bacterium]